MSELNKKIALSNKLLSEVLLKLSRLQCPMCRGMGELRKSIKYPCYVCLGKKIPPIPACEVGL